MDDASFILSSPAGWNYGQPEPLQEVAFNQDLDNEFQAYIRGSTNTRIFDELKMWRFRWYIEHPNQVLNTNPQTLANRAHALRYFEVIDGCLYRKEEQKPDGDGGVITIPRRYVALERNAFRFISNIH
jgi:hypothetical protein